MNDSQTSFPLFNDWVAFPSNTAYSVNQSGQVRREADSLHILVPTRLKSGYLQLSIGGKKKYVHRMVCSSFYGKIEPGYEPDHLNGTRDDNRIENLEVVSHKVNCQRRGKLIEPVS